MEINISKLCRTCMREDNEMFCIFEHNPESFRFDHIIMDITNIKIDMNDGLPANICKQCKTLLTNVCDFKLKSQKVDVILQELFKKNSHPASATEIIFENVVKSENEALALKYESCCDNSFADDNYSYETNIADDFCNMNAIKNEAKKLHTVNQCNMCSTLFESEVDLKEHHSKCIKVENESENCSHCPLCEVNFVDDQELTQHMLVLHPEVTGPRKRGRPMKLLSKVYSKLLLMNKNKIKSSKRKKYECVSCGTPFESKGDLTIHMKEHKDVKVSCCTLCKNMFLKKQKYDAHRCSGLSDSLMEGNYEINLEKDKNKEESYYESSLEDILSSNGDMLNWNRLIICHLCTAILLSVEDLKEHNAANHPISKKCSICLKVFTTVRAATNHRDLCKTEDHKHKCITCGVKFAYEISLNKHILKQHKGQSVSIKFIDSKLKFDDKKFSCDMCKKCFYRQDLLDRHSKIHQTSEKVFECEICKKKYASIAQLRSHQKCHNPDREKVFCNTCQYCGRRFSNSSNLIVHMRRHTGEKPYKCDFCQKGFPRSSDLQCHRRSHTGEKPCLCTICGKGFSRSNKLSRHMRVHTGQKPYKCIYCEKAFTQSNDLTLHIRRHTGDKPYVCEICGDRFIQGTALQNHRKAHGHFPTTSSATQESVQGLSGIS